VTHHNDAAPGWESDVASTPMNFKGHISKLTHFHTAPASKE
jgi:hypothetical protein